MVRAIAVIELWHVLLPCKITTIYKKQKANQQKEKDVFL
jgi:hypothetical protein